MNYTYSFSYLKCQSCTAKIHCDDCAAEIRERLMREAEIQDLQIDIPNKRISLAADFSDEMDLLDLLEEVGIFAD